KQKLTEMKQINAMKKSEKHGTGGDKSGVSEDRGIKASDKRSAKEDLDDSPRGSLHNDREAEDVGDDASWGSIVKRRRHLAAKAAAEREKQEKERLAIREKEHQEEKEREKLRKKQEQISEAINLARMVLRHDPIGTDRHHDRYWVFTNVTPGLYVEKGWMGEEINYSVQRQTKEESELEVSSESEEDDAKNENSTQKSVYRAKKYAIETSFPRPGQNLWFTYRSQKDLDGLLKSLHPQGIRESWLKAEIKKRYDDISRVIIQAQRTNLELRDSDGDTEMLAAFKKELSDMELRLRNGGLGGVPNYDKWETELMEATDISTLGECLLKVKDGILDKFLQGFMKPVSKASETSDDIKEEGDEENKKIEGGDKEKPHEKEDKTEKAVREWKEQVERCPTMSRLHVLMALLDSCVKWEKSAENAKCKICRKKCNDAQLLLCDECNQAFHMYCLRPALTKLPSGDWFCPACKPRKPELRSLDSDSEAGEEEEKEDVCRECGGSEKLIVCSKCPAAFHTQCHDPPLRHPPRGVWECSDCKSGVNRRRRKGKLSRRAASKSASRKEVSASEEEEEDDEEDEDDGSDEDFVAEPSNFKSRSQKQEAARGRERKQQNLASVKGRVPRSRTSSQKNSASVVTPTRGSRRGPSELSLCEDILHKVMKHKASWPFLEPVDKKLVPDYYTLIKKPMDFQTMLKKCTRLSYASPQEFIEDAALVFENAEAYNKADSEVYTCMQEVEKLFKEALHKLLPDWPYYRTVTERDESSSGSETGRRKSRNK
ncbi:unnamed protein product, partial [Candidula unifasciata]